MLKTRMTSNRHQYQPTHRLLCALEFQLKRHDQYYAGRHTSESIKHRSVLVMQIQALGAGVVR
jgi:hypothetical protein